MFNKPEIPNIIINKPYILIEGRSIPDDARMFWYPFIRHLEEITETWKQLEIDFKFDYYNTASTYFVTRIMTLLDEMCKRAKVKANWYYLRIDEDMQTAGEEFNDMFRKLNLNLIQR